MVDITQKLPPELLAGILARASVPDVLRHKQVMILTATICESANRRAWLVNLQRGLENASGGAFAMAGDSVRIPLSRDSSLPESLRGVYNRHNSRHSRFYVVTLC